MLLLACRDGGARTLLDELVRDATAVPLWRFTMHAADREAHDLTPRERAITEMLLRGLPIAEIARALWLSPYTIRDHIKALFAKLGVRSRPELTALLFHEHYTTPPPGNN